MRRRTFLKAGAGFFLASACAPLASVRGTGLIPLPDGLALDEDAVAFPYGVQAGGVEQASVLLWSVAFTADDVELWVWSGDGELLSRQRVERDEHAHLRAELTGLAPGTEHFYAFTTRGGERRSAAGRFVTAFADDEVRPLTVACATCTSWYLQPWRALERTAALDFDLLLHLGDMAYNDAAHTAAEYRASYRRALFDPGYRALLPRAATYHAWDDHELWNNLDPEADPERTKIAKRAFFESLPQRPGEDDRLWRSYRWGNTAEFLLLDARTERRPSTRGGEDIYLSPEQLDFVDERLRTSPCRFKVVMNSVPLSETWWPTVEDRWQGWTRQRDQLLEVLEDDAAARGTLFLSGDFHVGFVAKLASSGVHERLWEIAVGPSGHLNPLGHEWVRDVSFDRARFPYAGMRLAATTLALDPESGEARVRFIDAETGADLFDHVLEL